MLVRFSVENLLSFRERVELSMVASRQEDRNPNDVTFRGTSEGISLLKLAVIYGANASGKSNLVKAMLIAKDLILHPAQSEEKLTFLPFKLDRHCYKKPSRFEFEIKLHERYFAYGFSVSREHIVEEWLYEIDKKLERRIFSRSRAGIKLGDLSYKSEVEKQFLEFTTKGTLPNRLFLTECGERNVRENVSAARDLLDILYWFKNSLRLIFPDSGKLTIPLGVRESQHFKKELAQYLNCFDTGIDEIDLVQVDHAELDIQPEDKKAIDSQVDRDGISLYAGPAGEQSLFDRDDQGKLRAWLLVARHNRQNGNRAQAIFGMDEESDGTRRLMHLAPVMMALTTGEFTFVIDELDRSLHPEILHSYLANFLKYSAGLGSQLIVTTHDTTLLKQPFLRRDEVWFVEKGVDQSSRLVALEEFKKTPGGKDLQEDYLQGRFGGVPVIRDFSWLGKGDGKGT
jgi:uncharacterized protein